MSQSYSDIASPQIPLPTIRRRDRVHFVLRSSTGPVSARELVEHLRRNRLRDYNLGLAYNDLEALERAGLALGDYGRPRRWTARDA